MCPLLYTNTNLIFLKRLYILHTNKNTKGFDDMKNYKEIDNLLEGYSKSDELFTFWDISTHYITTKVI